MRPVFLWLCLAILPGFAAEETHWAYQRPTPGTPPPDGVHPVDALLDAARTAAGLKPAPLAAPRQWIERAAFTLTGLPASAAAFSTAATAASDDGKNRRSARPRRRDSSVR